MQGSITDRIRPRSVRSTHGIEGSASVAAKKQALTMRQRGLLHELLEVTWETQSLVDAPSFRASHVADRADLDALATEGLLVRDNDQYRVTLLGLDVLASVLARRILERGDALARQLKDRYVDPKFRQEHYRVSEIADLWRVPVAECVLTLRHFQDILGSWTGGWSPSLSAEDSWVVPGEIVCDNPDTASLIRQQRDWRERARALPVPSLAFVDAIAASPVLQRTRPNWHTKLPKALRVLMTEIDDARGCGSRVLSVLGLRTALDTMCRDLWGGDVGTFQEKLRRLAAEGLVSEKQLPLLESAVEVGNATSHRGHVPPADDVGAIFDIVESLLKQHYVLPSRASRAAGRVPSKRIVRR